MAGQAAMHDLRSLRKCVSAGEALPAATRLLWKQATGIEMIDGIGATELMHIFISADEAHSRPGATGTVVPGYVACVVDDEGQPVPAGTIGRLAVKGPTGCRYLADERQGDYVKRGWNLTGEGEVDARITGETNISVTSLALAALRAHDALDSSAAAAGLAILCRGKPVACY